MFDQSDILFYLLFIPHMLFALSIHEASHAGSAFMLGDDTAALQGRVTLNPLRHIDPMGLIAFFIIHFGWAKPVPVNPLRLKNPRRDEVLVSFAGPGSNLVMGVLLLVTIRLIWEGMGTGSETARTALAFMFVGAQLNVGLCFFNLIPIPPLDGSHILLGLLPRSWAIKLEPLMGRGFIILIVLVIVASFLRIPIFSYLIGVPMSLVMWGILGGEVYGDTYRILQGFLLI